MSCEICERPAGTAYLCARCEADLAERLGQLPALYVSLGAMLAPGRSADSGGRAPAAVEVPLPVRTDVVDVRGGFGILPMWARALADDRRLPELTSPRKRIAAPDDLGHRVTAACTALVAARGWIAASWPAAGDCAREVRDLYDGARSVVGAADLPARMGRCPQLVHGAACGAELLLPAGQQVVVCRFCQSRFPPGVWAALRVAQARVFSGAAAPGGPAARLSHA
ncbi:hypothetical protein [Streptomyces sp. NBC_01477]|uniref:hypothetical protein n=1 Tax=Streptomyces sp. NBC_01477 TaxID=2976015 RepID=UPI002E2EF2FA|nr:hypothetical protein [Streptomyces sp. NBC_01477]